MPIDKVEKVIKYQNIDIDVDQNSIYNNQSSLLKRNIYPYDKSPDISMSAQNEKIVKETHPISEMKIL